MRRPRSLRLTRFAALVAVVVWIPLFSIPGTAALAQAPSAEQPETARSPQPIALEDVPDRAENTLAELAAVSRGADSRPALEKIGADLDSTLAEVESHLAKTQEALAASPDVRTLRELATKVNEMENRLRPWVEELDKELAAIRAALQRLDAIAADWQVTAEVARRERAAGETVTRIAAVRLEIGKARSTVVGRRNQILAVRDRLVDPTTALAASREQLASATDARIRGIFHSDRPPPWSAAVRESLRQEWQDVGSQHFLQRLNEGGQYAAEQARVLGFQLALFVAVLLGLRSLRNRARARARDDYDLRSAEKVFEHPGATALLLVMMLSDSVHPMAPRGSSLVVGVLTAIAVTPIALRLLGSAMAPLAWGAVVFFAVDRVRLLLETAPTIERVVLLGEMVGAVALFLWLLRPRRLAKIPPELAQTPFLRAFGIGMRVAAGILVLAILADAAGWGDLSSLLGNGALRGGYSGLLVFVLFKVFKSLTTFALVLWPLRLLRSISRHQLLVRRRLGRVLSVLAVGLWVSFVLGQLSLFGPAIDGASRVLGTAVSVGALSISLGDVMAFGLTVWFSFLLARLVDFVLQQDVFTRVHAGRGVPYAVSGLVRYTLIFLGFLVALGAAGVELTKLTVVAGGLGVGIGFGLQNVVNNFVSGLILLFERPIQVGDTVQLPDVWGAIKRIGIRASVIRTFDGAEVIVPNGVLVSEKVTNWTLSDKRRRIEVDVGVRYGTPAQHMIDLLVGVAKANPNVIADPAPRAFFINFGDSALEFKLRAWVDVFDDGYSTRSDLAVAVQEALEQAGIGVPFPQRDLHLVSVSPHAASDGGSPTEVSAAAIRTAGTSDPGRAGDSGDGS